MNIEIISSSPRLNSVTYRLALHLSSFLKQNTKHNIGIIDVREWNLGLLQSVYSTINDAPQEHKTLAERIFNANAFVVITPEYNGSYSSALNNLFDHFPKQSKKIFGIVTASTGALGGIRASQQLLLLIPALFAIASPQMLIVGNVDKKFDADGNLIDEGFAKNVNTFTNEFLWLAEALYR